MKNYYSRLFPAFVFLGLFFTVIGCGGRSSSGRSVEPIDKTPREEREPTYRTIPPDVSDSEFAYLRERRPEVPSSSPSPATTTTSPRPRESVQETSVTKTTNTNFEPPAKNESEAENRRIHVVAQGETLWSLGRRYGVPWTQILAANESLNPNRISIGTKLVIPQTHN